jgi:hypothetical protein
VSDPYWSEVARLLPDVDLVLLSDEPAAGDSNDSRLVGAVRARQVRDEAHRVLRVAWQELAPDVPAAQSVRRTWRAVRPDAQLVQVELVARRPGSLGVEARQLLSAARAHQLASGRQVDERRWADSHGLRLLTEIDGNSVELYAVLSPPALTVTVLTAPFSVPIELGRELVAAGTEELPY